MKSAYLVGILLTLILGTFFNWVLCCDTAEEVVVEEVIMTEKESVVNPLVIKDSTGDFSYETNDNFNFKTSDYVIMRPLSAKIEEGVTELKAYIANEKQKFVDITGFYQADEENQSAFPNLGLARANAVKNYLLSLGVSSKQVNIYGEEKDDLPIQENIYIGPVSLTVTENSNIKDAQAIVDRIKDNPIVLHFDTGKSTIRLTDEQRSKYLDIVHALDKVDDVSILIEGHADNTGTPEGNMVLGKERAEFIKNYLVRNGISDSKIQTVSKGQDSPVAGNDTAEGRTLNRRTVITIK